MTIIRANSDGHTFELEVKGHAGYAPKGEDIVCAGVSTLVQTLLNCTDCIHKIKEGYVYIYGTGDIEYYKFAMTGLRLLEESYPEYVRINEGCTIFP